MKKLLVVILALGLIFLGVVYFFVPRQVQISRSVTIQANKEALLRKLGDLGAWKNWWPGDTSEKEKLTLRGYAFKPENPGVLLIPVQVSHDNTNHSAILTLVPYQTEFTLLQLQAVVILPTNPFKKIIAWYAANELEKSFTEILAAISNYYNNTASLYDYDIRKSSVKDSTLIFTSEEVNGHPSIEKIYSLIDRLHAYTARHGAKETDHPMLNIYTSDSLKFLVRVAIPVDRKLPDSANISYKWMLGGGNILITDVKGGPATIRRAYVQIGNYISDYHRLPPAISYESLVTDRRQQPDTSQWITRIYYPVM